MKVRPIGVFTATRAEYGLLRPVLTAMEASPTLVPRLIVSGTHLSGRHGQTYSEIEADGRTAAVRILVPLTDDSGGSVITDMSTVLAGAGAAYLDLGLEAVLILGDRTEALAAAAAAVPLALPILHMEGGHRTAGAVDDAIRHAVSKLAALHFTGAETYRQRLLQMGEAPDRVFTVGSTGVDNLKAFGVSTTAQASAITGLELTEGFVLATFHPETLTMMSPDAQAAAFIAGLAGAGERKLLITLPNADTGSAAIREALERFAAADPERVLLVPSLGAKGYAAALTACAAVVGNSSSGVIEAPAAGVPSVNIGERQTGRLRPASVIDCRLDPDQIAAALAKALDPTFRTLAANQPPMFGDGRAGQRIVDILDRMDFDRLAHKPFVDLIPGGPFSA